MTPVNRVLTKDELDVGIKGYLDENLNISKFYVDYTGIDHSYLDEYELDYHAIYQLFGIPDVYKNYIFSKKLLKELDQYGVTSDDYYYKYQPITLEDIKSNWKTCIRYASSILANNYLSPQDKEKIRQYLFLQ